MTARTIIDSKTCPECCKPFHRGPNHSRKEFAARKFCSIPCAVSGKRHTPPQRGQPVSTQWMQHAACQDSWFDFVTDSRIEALPALFECQGSACPVAAACFAFASATRAHGVWGGQFFRYGEVA